MGGDGQAMCQKAKLKRADSKRPAATSVSGPVHPPLPCGMTSPPSPPLHTLAPCSAHLRSLPGPSTHQPQSLRPALIPTLLWRHTTSLPAPCLPRQLVLQPVIRQWSREVARRNPVPRLKAFDLSSLHLHRLVASTFPRSSRRLVVPRPRRQSTFNLVSLPPRLLARDTARAAAGTLSRASWV